MTGKLDEYSTEKEDGRYLVDYRPGLDGYLSDSSVEEEQVLYHRSLEQIMRRAECYKEGARVRERLRRLGLAGDDGQAGGPGEHEEEIFYEDQMRKRFTTSIENV